MEFNSVHKNGNNLNVNNAEYHNNNYLNMDITDKQITNNKQTEFLRYPQNSPKPVIITIGDVGRLRPATYLNDSIIDFYLKYLYKERLNEQQRGDVHIFNQFFYTKLDSAINEKNESARLKLAKWTKNVNIFDKKLLIIPINSALHWSLAIITNPGYSKLNEPAMDIEDFQETSYDFCRNKVLSIISTSIFNEPEWVNTLKTNPQILAITKYPMKILHFDSINSVVSAPGRSLKKVARNKRDFRVFY